MRQVENEKAHTIQLMLERERCYVDQLRQQQATGGTGNTHTELEAATRRMAKLQDQLDSLRVREIRVPA